MADSSDGWLPWFNSADTFVERAKLIDDAAIKSGRSPEAIEKVAVAYVALTEDELKQKKIVDSMRSDMLSWSALGGLRNSGKVHPDKSFYSHQKCMASAEDAEYAERLGSNLPEHAVRRFRVTGNLSKCTDQIGDLISKGAKHVIIRDMLWAHGFQDFRETLANFGKNLIPTF